MASNILSKGSFFCILALMMSSCTPKKQLVSHAIAEEKHVSRAERANIMSNVAQNQTYFNTFSGRAKSKISINKRTYDVTANVRIEHNKAIWISISAIMGIEAGRVLITPDSVKVINRLEAAYVSKPFDYIHNFTSRELDFSSLQNLLVGNVISQAVDRGTDVSMTEVGGLLRGQADELLFLVQLDGNYRPVLTLLDEDSRNQRLEASYANYGEFSGRRFPSQVNVSIVADGLDLWSEMNYSRVGYDEVLEMPFSIPARYTEVQ